ncbi:MAG TPA: hypothetical protein DIT03_13425 [Candidatus Accumulibacter sp.]|nr:hypothetical protein [Accumulibacter sp.]HCN69231.1 hypothetical protein [Accumulibacter sp.]HCV13727.1 hypothetical protein [Accumulibacter sp.]
MESLSSLPWNTQTLTGTVVSVADGDTITVLDAHHEQHKIRVAGIDAPEKSQPFGQRSKESLSAMVFGKELDVQWHKHDRYQRIVGKVMVADPSCRATTCPRTLDAGWTRPWQYEKQRGTQA